MSGGPSSRVTRRAAAACTFCRRRKIKCSNDQPTCNNCKTYGKDCVYAPIDHGPATGQTPSRRSRLTTDRRSSASTPTSRARAEDSGGHEISVLERPASPPSLSSNQNAPSTESGIQHEASDKRDAEPRPSASTSSNSHYHGRTSALFEENLHRQTSKDARPRISDDLIEQGLVANALRQRQLENVNLRAGKLDFDGLDPELGLHLLSLHWNRQHHSFLVTYRPAFMRDMACGGPYFSKLLLNAIYYGASKFSPRHEVRKDPADVRTAGWKFRERVRELLGSALDQSDISTIQALLIMTNSLFALGDERSAAWLYAGLAFRMIVDLGMHIDVLDFVGARKFTEEDLEIRRRVFWGAFVIDKIQSLYQGRPFTIKESDTLVPIKFLDTYEELENWIPFAYSTQSRIYPGSPAYSISTFKSLCTLSVVMSDVLSTIYAERSFEQSPTALASMLEKLQARLESWRQSLPDHLNLDAANPGSTIPPPHVLSLHAMYHVLVILLHRPFVADGHLYSALRAVSVKSFLACAEAASSIVGLLRAYDTAFSVRRAPYLISYATYVAATIHVRIAAKRRHDVTVFSNLETCLAVFNENESTNWAVKRANTVIRNLMDRMKVIINESDDGPQIHVGARRAANPPQERNGGPTVPARPTVLQDENGEVALPSGVEDDPAITPNADWLDIDGIIQSFLAGQGESSDQSGVLDSTLYSVHATRDPVTVNGDFAPLTTSQTSVRPVPESDGARPNGLPQAGEMNTFLMATLDDPLFGFNGSGLDSIDDYRWI